MTKQHTSNSDELYGFGAHAPLANTTTHRRNAGILTLFAAALSCAVAITVSLTLHSDNASANPVLQNAMTHDQTLGLAAAGAFGLSTMLCAAVLVSPFLVSRHLRKRRLRR